MAALRRGLPLWTALLAVYVLAFAVAGPATDAKEHHRLAVAHALLHDREIREGPQSLGFEALIAPAQSIGGETGVRVWLAALCALAFCLAAALGRRLVPDPWSTRAALVAGLSPPAIGASTAIAPEAAGAACLAGAALLALRVRERPRLVWTFWAAALAAALPWLAAKLVAPAAVTAAALARWLRRRQRGLAGFVALEVFVFSGVVYITVSDRVFGGLTAQDLAGGGATGASGLGEHLARWPRLWQTWLGPDAGLLLWAPFFALAGVACWLLWRSHRDRLAAAIPEQADVEAAATFLLALVAATWLVAVFLAPSIDPGGRSWSHGRQLVPVLPALAALCAWGLRFAPRAGTLLAAATLALSVAMVAT